MNARRSGHQTRPAFVVLDGCGGAPVAASGDVVSVSGADGPVPRSLAIGRRERQDCAVDRAGRGFQQSSVWKDRADGVAGAGVSLFAGGNLQDIWRLQQSLGDCRAGSGLFVLGADLHSGVLHREKTLWRDRPRHGRDGPGRSFLMEFISRQISSGRRLSPRF